MIDVVVALTGLPDEPEIVRGAEAVGLSIVRRCVDAVDLLAAAALSSGTPVVLASGLPRLTADVVKRLGDRPIIGVAADALGAQRLERIGVEQVIIVAPSPLVTLQQVADVCAVVLSTAPGEDWYKGSARSDSAPDSVAETLDDQTAATVPSDRPSAGGGRSAPGRVIVVWGPVGAPGRSTVAMGVSEQLAEHGHRVCLVDADTYGASIALALGLLEDASGLVVACRHAEAGSLTARSLASLTMTVPVRGPGHWRVLGGLVDAERWRELRRSALDRLWVTSRETFDVTVVDVGFCLESDDESSAWARERNAPALSAMADADHIVAVAESSRLGAARLVNSAHRVRELAPAASLSIVRNRARGSVAPWREVTGAVLPDASIVDLPEDSRTLRACWERGRSLGEGGRRSRIHRAMERIAATTVSG